MYGQHPTGLGSDGDLSSVPQFLYPRSTAEFTKSDRISGASGDEKLSWSRSTAIDTRDIIWQEKPGTMEALTTVVGVCVADRRK
jgi:hypothetical protein